MKDPAVLLYTNDFLTGAMDLTMEERGQYITLLCLQHQKGRLTEKTIRLTVGSVSDDVLEKFDQDENGNYFNKRMDEEINKRQKFIDSRRQNGSMGGRPKKANEKHMVSTSKASAKANENLIENENVNVNSPIKGEFEKFWDLYDYKVGKDDCWAYWSGSKRLKSGFKLTAEDRDKIMDVVSDYVRATNKDGVFPARKHPKTWLYNSGWQDEIPQPKRTTGFTRAEVYGNRKQYEEWDERTG